MIKVDFHTHWGRVWTRHDGDNPDNWLRLARGYGISHSLVLPEHGLFNDAAIAAEHDLIAKVCARSGGAMLPAGTACLHERDEAVAEVQRCLQELQFKAIKFHPWLQGCSTSMKTMDEIAEIAAAYEVPLIFHDGTPTFALPSQMALLAQRHPDTKVILGHAGLFEHYREAAAAVNSTGNVWACLSGPHLAGLRYLIKNCPLERLLWGTDGGFQMTDFYQYRVPLMELLDLSEEQQNAIYASNPQTLLKVLQ